MKELLVKLGLDFGGFNAGLQSAVNSARGFAASIAGAFSPASIIGGLAGGWTAKEMIEEAHEAAQIQKQLEATLRTTGYAAGFTADQLSGMAKELQKTTHFSDDATKSAMDLLATFRNVRGDVFQRTIAVAQDISTAGGQELNSVVQKLGMAMSDPTAGLGKALKAEGIFVSDDVERQIKSLQEAGKLVEAQKILLGELESSYAGMAQEMADPFRQVKNELADVSEQLGNIMLPTVLTVAKAFRDWLQEMNSEESGWAEFAKGIEGAVWHMEFLTYSVANFGATLLQVGGQIAWFISKLGGSGAADVTKWIEKGIYSLDNRERYEYLMKWRDEFMNGPEWASSGGDFGPGAAPIDTGTSEKQRKHLEDLQKFVDQHDPMKGYIESTKKWNQALAEGLVTLEQHREAIAKLQKDIEEKLAKPLTEAEQFDRDMLKAEEAREQADIERLANLRREADQVNLEEAGPQAKMMREMERLMELRDGGLSETALAKRAQRLMRGMVPEMSGPVANAQAGSMEAYRWMAGAQAEKKTESLLDGLLDQVKSLFPEIYQAVRKYQDQQDQPDAIVGAPI